MEVLDEDASSLQAMASAPLLGRTVCASCNEEIMDKYLLKVNVEDNTSFTFWVGIFIYYSCLGLDSCGCEALAAQRHVSRSFTPT